MAQELREKKIEVVVDGRTVRIMPHMIGDVTKFGASEPRKIIKEPPKELMQPLKKIDLSKSEVPKDISPLPKVELPREPELPVEPLNDPIVAPVIPVTSEKTEIKKVVKNKKSKK